MNKLKTYEAPSTRVAKVELRTNLLAASIMEDKQGKAVEVEAHEVGGDYDFGGKEENTTGGFSVTWDE